MLSYLPLAHLLERIVTHACLIYAVKIGYSQGDMTKLVDDIQTLRPTILVAVPRILNKIYDGIQKKIAESGFIKRTLFNFAVNQKLKNLKESNEYKSSWDSKIFNKIREM